MDSNNFFEENKDVIGKLLNTDNVSLQYRVRKELMNESEQDLLKLKSKIPESEAVKKIFAKMHPDGYWLQKKSSNGDFVGDNVEYGSFATTHFCLSYLAELGLTREHSPIEKVSERYLNLQQSDGDWYMHLSCLIGYNIHTFVKLGYIKDERIKRSVQLLLNTNRNDGGYLCDLHEKYGKNNKKSCFRGSIKALMALSHFPEFYSHPRTLELLDYFLSRDGVFKSKNKEMLVNKDMSQLTFPITWRTNLWEVLFTLSAMGYGNDKRLENAWRQLDGFKKENDFFVLDYTPAQIPYKFGARGKGNPWITFYLLLALKLKRELNAPSLLT